MSEATEEILASETQTPMTDDAAAPLTPGTLPPTQRDIQRLALRDLVSLATESAATETEIEQKFHAASEEADKELEQGLWAAEQRFNSTSEAARQKAQERTAAADAKYAADVAAVKKRDEQARQKIAGDHDPATQQLKQRYEKEVWLADSVLESTQGGVHEELKKFKDATNAELNALKESETKANTLLNSYGVTVPAVEHQPQVTPEAADETFATSRDTALSEVQKLGGMLSARLAVGVVPIILVILLTAAGAAAGQYFLTHSLDQLHPKELGIGAGAGFVLAIILWVVLRGISHSGARKHYTQFGMALLTARAAADVRIATATKIHDQKLAEAQKFRDGEVRKAKEKISPQVAKVKASREAALQAQMAEYRKQGAAVQQQRDAAKKEITDWLTKTLADISQKYEREKEKVRGVHAAKTGSGRSGYDTARQSLEHRLREGLASTQAPIEDTSGVLGQGAPNWAATDWRTWKPSKQFASVVRFGELGVDLKKIADSVPRKGPLKLQLPPPYAVPALLAFPKQASLIVESDREGRDAAMRIVQMAMVRLLTSLPPGRVRFTMIDPVGLGQNFAGFMHLADFDEATVSGRIFTDTEQINQRLTDLTDHMQTVIQKYLRNEFETIDEYNAQAGELAEPYRFLVIADFPVAFESEALRRLSSIAASGARCGVYTIIARDTRQEMPGSGTYLDDLYAHGTVIRQDGDKFVWHDDVYQQFPLTIDPAPDEETLTQILQAVGSKAKDAKRVEVPFDTIAPKVSDFWTMRSDGELRVPIGKTGATRLQSMRLGKGVAQHVIIAGKTGSGKSTLLHALIANLAMWYSPDEVEMYLIDFKKGVEFKTYATHNLPHARAIAVESDREFGLSVLQRLDGELTRRGDIFRRAGAQNITDFRRVEPTAVMPRTLLVIDEFQEFFTEDDKLAQDASLLIDRLVRQGRAFGIHVLLGSQTIGGSGGLNRATIGQMAVRVALMTSEADSQLILGDGNSAARLLSRPGEAIYNDQNGAVEGNSPFQVAYLSDEGRDVYLERVNAKLSESLKKSNKKFEPPLVFEGNAPADINTNVELAKLINSPTWPENIASPIAWMGDPVAIKDPSGAYFRRQSGANLMIIGQSEENAIAISAASLISLAAQHKPSAARFYIFDGNAVDSPFATVFPMLKGMLPHEVNLVEYRAVEEIFEQLEDELKKRQAGEERPSIFVIIYGLQRYRMLRKSEDTSFSFGSSPDEAEKKSPADKIFNDLIKEGPNVGIHIITWIDTPSAIDRTFERGVLREFDTRVLFQMSAADSSNLVDSPAANKLGFFRALQYSEEQGSMEKFRPYAMPETPWLENMKAKFAAKT